MKLVGPTVNMFTKTAHKVKDRYGVEPCVLLLQVDCNNCMKIAENSLYQLQTDMLKEKKWMRVCLVEVS